MAFMSKKLDSKTNDETCRDNSASQTSSTFERIVHQYITRHRDRVRRELKYYALQRSLENAIELAALSKLPSGKRHPHQYRIPRQVLNAAKEELLAFAPELQTCKTFADLIEKVHTAIRPIKGIGELAVYDISLRIGAYLELAPERVYIHSGTRSGAKAIGVYDGQKSIALNKLPTPFHELTPREVEDCLCIYKDALKRA
jgi:hypothetical protein